MMVKSDTKFEETLTCGLENDMRNLANFEFDGIFLSEVKSI